MMRWVITAATAGAVLTSASVSLAVIDKCQMEIEKRTSVFRSKVEKALTKCSDSIRKEVQKNNVTPGKGFLVNGAKTCQIELGKIFDMSKTAAGKDERSKFYAAIDNAFAGTSPKCNGLQDLTTLGHMAGGTGNLAPGTNIQDFVKTWLAVDSVRSALNDQIARQADFITQLAAAIDAPAKPPGTSVATAETDCSQPETCNPKTVPGCRPDLCKLKVQCREHACTLAAGSQTNTIALGGNLNAPGALTGRAVMSVCNMKGLGYGLGDGGEGLLVTGSPSLTINPPNIFGNTVCVNMLRMQGYCACSGGFLGRPKNTAFCSDHILSDGDDCIGGTALGPNVTESCFCAAGQNPTTTPCGPGLASCTAPLWCGLSASGAPCHPGTEHTAVKVTNSGNTAAGDCVSMGTTQFTVLPAGGDCDGGGPSNNPASFGPDCEPCTADDLTPPSTPSTVPFTTGSASAQIKDTVAGAGNCTIQTNNKCIEDLNCHTAEQPLDTCDGQQDITDIAVGPDVGAPAPSCAALASGNLSGMTLVGGFPALDASQSLGDLVTTFKFICQ